MRYAASILIAILILMVPACSRRPKGIVTLTSDPDWQMTFGMMWYFSHQTLIKVVQNQNHDPSGAVSTARLIAEQDKEPKDVYWSGDAMYCEILRQRGFLLPQQRQEQIPSAYRDPNDYWTGFSGRARVLLVRRSMVADRPASIRAYTDPARRGRGALENPLSGTTRTHFAALAAQWGDRELASFYDALVKNGTRITKSTEESADLVASGACDFALVDTDIALSQIAKGKPVDIIYPDQQDLGVMIVPNAVCILRGCKDVASAQKLVDFITTSESEVRIVRLAPYLAPVQKGVGVISGIIRRIPTVRAMPVDYAVAAEKHLNMEKILAPTQAAMSERKEQRAH